jgi:antitoxin (DNA-binding transcriptional repressor) of toxin-antitoxin stability system
MASYTIRAAKADLSKLIAHAEAGQEVVLLRGKKAVAKIVPVTPKPERIFGRIKGKGSVGPEFFAPLPEEDLKLWE